MYWVTRAEQTQPWPWFSFNSWFGTRIYHSTWAQRHSETEASYQSKWQTCAFKTVWGQEKKIMLLLEDGLHHYSCKFSILILCPQALELPSKHIPIAIREYCSLRAIQDVKQHKCWPCQIHKQASGWKQGSNSKDAMQPSWGLLDNWWFIPPTPKLNSVEPILFQEGESIFIQRLCSPSTPCQGQLKKPASTPSIAWRSWDPPAVNWAVVWENVIPFF